MNTFQKIYRKLYNRFVKKVYVVIVKTPYYSKELQPGATGKVLVNLDEGYIYLRLDKPVENMPRSSWTFHNTEVQCL